MEAPDKNKRRVFATTGTTGFSPPCSLGGFELNQTGELGMSTLPKQRSSVSLQGNHGSPVSAVGTASGSGVARLKSPGTISSKPPQVKTKVKP